ncbi:hypothetical protein [Burkholderia thailandensis]|nr:hypothetical protein [Burkholderia thailandensis]AHI68568.1 hypothetical protein BTL_5721 [Burkholderia thailandensis H0587]AHI76072.1 hypothetical protein BTQ_3897 [Burkholderia thailandensis 2002721723]AHI82231.1 hypothetical protein BTJ_4930 [Burkholderia thailandensis E444]AIC90374.1 hypothetical protein BTRA_5660 [Burkholderia thailandensis USAMRU Malaysia \
MKRSLIAFALTGIGVALSGAAHAVTVNIGRPAPVVAAPAAAPVVGWHGDRYWDGKRYWQRREWDERNRSRNACPPGHAKKGKMC